MMLTNRTGSEKAVVPLSFTPTPCTAHLPHRANNTPPHELPSLLVASIPSLALALALAMSAPLRFATTPADVSRFAGVFEHVFETVTAGVTLQSPQVGLSFLPVYRLPICLL